MSLSATTSRHVILVQKLLVCPSGGHITTMELRYLIAAQQLRVPMAARKERFEDGRERGLGQEIKSWGCDGGEMALGMHDTHGNFVFISKVTEH